MFVVLLLVFAILFFLQAKIEMDRLSRVFIYFFLGVWAISILLASCEPYGMRHIGIYTYAIMIANVLSFCFGFNCLKIQNSNDAYICDCFNKDVNTIIGSVAFKITLIILCLYILSLLFIFRDVYLVYHNINEVRHQFFSEDALYGKYYPFIKGLAIDPFAYLCIPVFAYMTFFKRNVFWILILFFLVGKSTLAAGRFEYMDIMAGLAFVIIGIIGFSVKKKKLVHVGFFALAVFFILIFLSTSARSGNLEGNDYKASLDKTMKSVVEYSAGPIAAFDYGLENDYMESFGGYQLGTLTFSSIDDIVFLFFHVAGHDLKRNLNEVCEIKQKRRIDIGSSKNFNALYTAVFYFYYDFGVAGVLIFPLLFGILARLCMKKLYETGSFCFVILSAWVIIKIVRSIYDFYFNNFYHLLFLVVILLIEYLKSKKQTICLDIDK